MNNTWNKLIYKFWSFSYDFLFDSIFGKGRIQAMKAMALKRGERVCLVGIGTGADIPLLQGGVKALGIDLSESMLRRARLKVPERDTEISFRLGNAESLPIEPYEEKFNAVLLNLILSVVPNPVCCVREALRILDEDGRIVIFDKFLPDTSSLSFGRWALNFVTSFFGTDINRRLADILADFPVEVEQNEPSIFRGVYRVIRLRRKKLLS